MRVNKLVKVISFLLVIPCVAALFVACKNEPSETDGKEAFIDQLKRDFATSENDEAIEFTADPFAQLADLSAMFSIDVSLRENRVYLNGTLYDSIKLITSPEISYDERLLIGTNPSITNDEVATVMQKIQSSESCYVLETESATPHAKAQKIAVYIIDGKYYFVSYSNYDNNELIRIHY